MNPLFCCAPLTCYSSKYIIVVCFLTGAPAACNGSPGSFLPVCSAAQPGGSLKTKQRRSNSSKSHYVVVLFYNWYRHLVVSQPFPHRWSFPLELVQSERGTRVWGSGCTVTSPRWRDIGRPVLTGTGSAVKWYPVSVKTRGHTFASFVHSEMDLLQQEALDEGCCRAVAEVERGSQNAAAEFRQGLLR